MQMPQRWATCRACESSTWHAHRYVCSLSRCSGLLWCGFLAAACSLDRLRALHLAHSQAGQARHAWLGILALACGGPMLTDAQPGLPLSPCVLSCVLCVF